MKKSKKTVSAAVYQDQFFDYLTNLIQTESMIEEILDAKSEKQGV
jgi:hypothetical protein